MRMFTIIFLIIITAKAGFTQQKTIDSLQQELSRHPVADTTRLDLLNELAYAYYVYDPDKGIAAADQAIAIGKKLHTPKRLAASFSHKGLNHSVKGEDSLALHFYNQALQLHTSINNKPGIGKVLHNMGLIYFGLSDYYQAIELHSRSFEIFRSLNDSMRMSYAKNSIGVNYMYLSDYPKSLEYFLQTLSIFEKLNNRAGSANCFSNIGIIYKKLSDYKKSLSYHQKSYDIFKEIGNKEGMSNGLGNMGVVYDAMEQYNEALAFYERALQIGKETDNKRTIASNLTNIGSVYKNQRNYNAALTYLHQAEILYTELGDKNNLASVLNQTGNIYAISNAGKAGYKKAINLQKQALKLSTEIDAVDRQSQSWENLSETYTLQGDYVNALKAFKNYIQLRDSIMNDEKAQEIGRKEMKFESEKKEAIVQANHLAAITREKLQRKNIVIIASAILAVGILSFILFKRKKEAVAKKNEAEMNAAIANTEMKALRAQMNPHFIFNSLNSIGDYIRKNNIADADRYLVKFAKLMRLILENSEKKEILIGDDLQALELYMQLEQLRTKNKFTHEINIDSAIDKETTMIPPLILQPFVENSIWHGIAKKEGVGKICISIKKEDDMINCIIEDDGVGRNNTALSENAGSCAKKKSLGMKITNERIDILNKEKNTAAAIYISDLPQGTKVEIKLPFIVTI